VFQSTEQVRQADVNVRDAVRFGAMVAVVGIAFLATAAVWMSTCTGATADTVACGVPQRTFLAVGAPLILLLGGLRAFVRTYQTWRKQETWWAWQGAGWFLVTLMLVVMTMSQPIVGSAVFLG
jgi:uncharacterized membrane protein